MTGNLYIKMKLDMSITKKPVSNYKNKNRIKKNEKEFHQARTKDTQ